MSKLCSVALSNVTVWVGLHCEIVVFPDHTACTEPGNIVPGGGPGPSATGLFLLVLNFIYRSPNRFFSKKTIIFQDSRGGPTFSEGGGGPIAYFL